MHFLVVGLTVILIAMVFVLKEKIKNELKYKDANMEDQKNKYRQATY